MNPSQDQSMQQQAGMPHLASQMAHMHLQGHHGNQYVLPSNYHQQQHNTWQLHHHHQQQPQPQPQPPQAVHAEGVSKFLFSFYI